MKKFLIVLLALVLVVFTAGCNIGTFKPGITIDDPTLPDDGYTDNGKNPGNGGDDEEGGDPTQDEGYTFSVTLYTRDSSGNPEAFYLPANMKLYAQWVGSDGAYQSEFSYKGVAEHQNLDGEYKVSIVGLPGDYTYDPNGKTANNNKRDIQIELLPIVSYNDGNGTLGRGEYSCIRINRLGTYHVELKSRNDIIYFEYLPAQGGTYHAQSIADTMADEINPKVEWTFSTFAFKFNWHTPGEGEWGSVGDYTRNFNISISLPDEEVGNVLTLALSAQHIGNKFPVDFFFTIWLGDQADFIVDYPADGIQGPFYDGPSPDVEGANWQWSYRDNQIGNNYYTDGTYAAQVLGAVGEAEGIEWNGNVYDYQPADRIRLNTNDGFYHLYDPVKYAEYEDVTGVYGNGYGPLVWAVIGGWDEIYQRQEYDPETGETYEGDHLIGRISNVYGYNYTTFIKTYAMYPEDPAKWDDRKTVGQQIGGYHVTLFSNHDSKYNEVIHPLNAELREALNRLALALGYYYDGSGNAENTGPDYANALNRIVSSGPDSMYLIFCGYYTYAPVETND